MKICVKCNISQPYENYCKKINEKDGLYYYCKTCVAKSRKGKKQYNEYKRNWNKNDYNTNIKSKIASNVRCRLHHALKAKNEVKKGRSLKYLGCSILQYKTHLEKQFSNKMNWDNYGSYWEVDHIIPLSKGGSFHYSNTQPLTIRENREKSDRII